MAYSELIKNFERTRSYIREFYVYGYKSRAGYEQKSSRSYDEERRRIESWLAAYMQFDYSEDGKRVYISINSRTLHENPLFRIWKTKSFTSGDITLHFILFDILSSGEKYTLQQLMDILDEMYLSFFDNAKTFDISTVRKKLKEYELQGMVQCEKAGKTLLYQKVLDRIPLEPLQDSLMYFREVLPCGVIGSFITDKEVEFSQQIKFAFKHHYVTQVMDSEILYYIFDAIHDKCEITIEVHVKKSAETRVLTVVPLRLLISAQNGRQYLLAYDRRKHRISTNRVDYITNVFKGTMIEEYDALRTWLANIEAHMWGVSTGKNLNITEHVEFTIQFSEEEYYIYKRLLREKRCGTLVK